MKRLLAATVCSVAVLFAAACDNTAVEARKTELVANAKELGRLRKKYKDLRGYSDSSSRAERDRVMERIDQLEDFFSAAKGEIERFDLRQRLTLEAHGALEYSPAHMFTD